MATHGRLAHLDDRQVVLVLGHLTGDLPASTRVQSEDDAREAVAAFLAEFGDETVDPGRLAGSDVADDAAARALLQAMLDDPATAAAASELVDDPPDDEQLSVELALMSAVLLGATIAWLQTKVSLEITVEDGKRSFRFTAHKEAADPGVIKDVVATIRRALLGD